MNLKVETLRSIYLSCVWSNLSEDIIVDNEAFSDLNPQQSNDWSITIFDFFEKCDIQLTKLLFKLNDGLKRTITVNQILGGMKSSTSNTSIVSGANEDIDDQLKRVTLEKLTNSSSLTGSKRLDRVVNLSSNIMEKATNKMKIMNLNDDLQVPLDQGFLDYIMDVCDFILFYNLF